jgi:hypothetical protein
VERLLDEVETLLAGCTRNGLKNKQYINNGNFSRKGIANP